MKGEEMRRENQQNLFIDETVCLMDFFEEDASAAAANGGDKDGDFDPKKKLSEVEAKSDGAAAADDDEEGGGSRNLLKQMGMLNSTTQLTIFYQGSISVYDSVPAEKAQAIMLIAAATAAAAKITANHRAVPTAAKAPAEAAAAMATPALKRCPSQLSSSAAAAAALGRPHFVLDTSSSLCKLQAEIPMTRRQSLQRFLEKRQDRLASKAPYASAKMDKPDGAELPLDMQPELS